MSIRMIVNKDEKSIELLEKYDVSDLTDILSLFKGYHISKVCNKTPVEEFAEGLEKEMSGSFARDDVSE